MIRHSAEAIEATAGALSTLLLIAAIICFCEGVDAHSRGLKLLALPLVLGFLVTMYIAVGVR